MKVDHREKRNKITAPKLTAFPDMKHTLARSREMSLPQTWSRWDATCSDCWAPAQIDAFTVRPGNYLTPPSIQSLLTYA